MRGAYEAQSRSVHEVRKDSSIDSVATVAIRSEFRKRSIENSCTKICNKSIAPMVFNGPCNTLLFESWVENISN
ncbi:IS630 family transposase domain protein [Rickettsiales endosymbiont of Paramecium tredecaurelia]|nr:IS630 family transposase domain protein [Candidatus Sarmatiella mevalonica]